MGIDLQKLIDTTQIRGITVWVEHPDIPGFEVEVAFVGKQEMLRIVDTCTKRVWNSATRQNENQLSREKVAQHWAEKVVRSWKGLTLEKFQKLYPISLEGQKKESIVEPDITNRVTLLWNCADFENWVLAIATSPEYFVDARVKAEEDLKTLETQ